MYEISHYLCYFFLSIWIACGCMWSFVFAGGVARCPASHLAVGHYACRNYSARFFHTCHAYGHWILPFNATYSDLDLARGHKVSRKPVGPSFSHTFQLIGMIFNVMLKRFKLNIVIVILSMVKGTAEHLQTDLFQTGTVIETLEICILIPVWMTLIFIQGYNLRVLTRMVYLKHDIYSRDTPFWSGTLKLYEKA